MTKDEWIDRFMTKVGELLPTMSPLDAARRADDTYRDARDLDPVEAAEIYAMELPPGDVGAPE